MANALIYRGQTFQGRINLKQNDGIDPNNIFPYIILGGSVVEVHFPADPNAPNSGAPVILSTANVGEINVDQPTLGSFLFTGSPTKSLNLEVGSRLSVDVKITEPGGDVRIFEKQKVLTIKDTDNP